AMLDDFYNIISDGLAEKLGCVLFQLPPTYVYTPERLDLILRSLDLSFHNVLDFRHLSWWHPDVYDALAKKGVSFCGMSKPGLPDALIHQTDVVYYRLHGVPELYKSSYDIQFLQNIIKQVKAQTGLNETYFYFNNDI